ncbi:ubiquinol-cytochrome c reductase complex 6.7 kDa protein [Rosa rugosa]|nr:ubiquinol-cytochrome c reductase complex 6.7 kDa protein [Rosa rugosa]
MRPPSTDLKATTMWGVVAGTGALWFVQPFDWLKKTFLEKPKTQGQNPRT